MRKAIHRLLAAFLTLALISGIVPSALAYTEYESFKGLSGTTDLGRDVAQNQNVLRYDLETPRDNDITLNASFTASPSDILFDANVRYSGGYAYVEIEFNRDFIRDTHTPFQFSVTVYEIDRDTRKTISRTTRSFRGIYENRIDSRASEGEYGRAISAANTPRPTPNTAANTPGGTVSQAAAVSMTRQAVGEGKPVVFRNAGEISLATMRAMSGAAGSLDLRVNADSLNAAAKGIDTRISFDPGNATKTISLAASTYSDRAKATAAFFGRHFSNELSVVNFAQQGDFGMRVSVAARINPNLDTDSLVFYSYDRGTNKYQQIKDISYRADSKGFVHFSTSLAGDIVITDKPLARK